MTVQIAGVDPTVPPSGTSCVECEAASGWWLHLRRCTQCGHIGCCDTSPSQHATAHSKETGHPVIRSFEPGETWFWSYPGEDFYDSGPELAGPGLAGLGLVGEGDQLVLTQDHGARRLGVPLQDDLDLPLLGEDRQRPDLRVAAEHPQAGEVTDRARRPVAGHRREHAQVRPGELVEEPALVEQLGRAGSHRAGLDLS